MIMNKIFTTCTLLVGFLSPSFSMDNINLQEQRLSKLNAIYSKTADFLVDHPVTMGTLIGFESIVAHRQDMPFAWLLPGLTAVAVYNKTSRPDAPVSFVTATFLGFLSSFFAHDYQICGVLIPSILVHLSYLRAKTVEQND